MTIALFPVKDVEALWERYASLARAFSADPEKLVDKDFHITMARAYAEWREAFIALDARR